jgi:predicted dehydrogenase
MINTTHIARRHFLKSIIASATAPMIIPGSVLGLDGTIAPSDRITMGLIGVGSRMGGVWGAFKNCKEIQGIAVCDVWEANRENYRKSLNLQPQDATIDFRELLARRDIDTVAIATPDHWHVPISIAAIKAGKDVYCEKPLCNTIQEGRALVNTATQYGAVFQHGTQLHSMSGTRRACELVRNGRIGKIKEIRIGSPAGHATGHHAEQPIPKGLNYDLWLGPAPYRPFTHSRVFRDPKNNLPGWYFVSDYSKAGWIAGYAVHDLDIAQWAIGMDRSGPVTIEGQGVYPKDGLFDTVTTYKLVFEYSNGVRIVVTNTDVNPHGVTFEGEKGTVFTRGEIDATPKTLLREVIGPNETHLYQTTNHAQNFVDCVRSRAETITPAEIAHRATSTALLGGIACQLGRKLHWNPTTEQFINDDTANGLLRCSMRAPWQV